MTHRTIQSCRSRDEAIVQCLRIFARQGRKIRMQRKSVEQESSLENSVMRLTDSAIQKIMEFAEDVFIGIENADFGTKRRILEMLDTRVVVDSGRYEMESIAGRWDGEIRKIKRNLQEGIADTYPHKY